MFLVLGAVGWVMKNIGFPRIPFLIGFVLAESTERYLHLSMSLHGYTWLVRPIVVIIGVAVFVLIFGTQARVTYKSLRARGKSAVDETLPR